MSTSINLDNKGTSVSFVSRSKKKLSLSVRSKESRLLNYTMLTKEKEIPNEENFDNENIDEDYHPKEVYTNRPMNTYHDIEIEADNKSNAPYIKYNRFLNKILTSELLNEKRLVNNKLISNEMKNDIDFLEETKEKMINIQEYYGNELIKIQYDLTKQSKIKESSTTVGVTDDNRIKKDGMEVSQKEMFYKETIQSLMKELKLLTGDNVDPELSKEVDDFLNMNEDIEINLSNEAMNNSSNPIRRSRTKYFKLPEKEKYDSPDTSLITELENFKEEEHLYKFEIPSKYQMPQFTKCKKEKKIKGRLVRFYENSVIDIIGKKKTITRIFPDGFEIWFYNNKDVEQRFPNGRIYYYYNRNKSSEFRFLNENFLVYKFPNGQYEKHYFDNSMNIKFTDGSYRIIRHGKELIQFPNGTIQIQDKNGIIYKKNKK